MTTSGSSSMFKRLALWVLNDPGLYSGLEGSQLNRLDPVRVSMFLLVHLACFGALVTGVSWTAFAVMVSLYVVRMFFITAFYHRYFSHRAYRVGRLTQFIMAMAGCTAGQRGPLWWSAHHRVHHAASDTGKDPHSPLNGFIDSHMLWFLRRANFATPVERIPDWLSFPELRWLERLDWVPFLGLACACYLLGAYLQAAHPELHTSGLQMLVWGFVISTVLLYHGTYTINSLAHRFGSRRFDTRDHSRNNWVLALITLGEGWHNNHHRFPAAARQGFYLWELDISYLGLKLLSVLGLARDLRTVPLSVLEEGRRPPGK